MAKNYYLKVDVSQDCKGNLCICDNTGFGEDGFLPERIVGENEDKYTLYDVGIYTVVKYIGSKESTLVFQDFKKFTEEEIEDFNFNYTAIIDNKCVSLDKDGYYVVQYFAIPFVISFLAPYTYYCDEEGNIFNDDDEPVELDDLVFEYSNMMHYNSRQFSYNNLKNKYIDAAYNKIYKNEGGVLNKIKKGWCCDSDSTDVVLTQTVIGSALAAIRYLLEACKYDQAQLIIEQLSGCGDIYINGTGNTSQGHGCGCNK